VIETAVLNLILADANVVAIIGDRVRPFTDTTNTSLPALTYWRKNTNRPFSNDGPTGQGITSFQLDAWATTATTCWQILDAVRLALDGIQGSYFSTRIDYIHVTDQTDQTNTPVRTGNQKPIQRATMDIEVSYTESLRVIGGGGFGSGFSSGWN
jgi:hypothetical protein